MHFEEGTICALMLRWWMWWVYLTTWQDRYVQLGSIVLLGQMLIVLVCTGHCILSCISAEYLRCVVCACHPVSVPLVPSRWRCALFALPSKHEFSIDQIFGLSMGCLLEPVDFVVWTKSQKWKKAWDVVVGRHFIPASHYSSKFSGCT